MSIRKIFSILIHLDLEFIAPPVTPPGCALSGGLSPADPRVHREKEKNHMAQR
jgi:hypothetical protein